MTLKSASLCIMILLPHHTLINSIHYLYLSFSCIVQLQIMDSIVRCTNKRRKLTQYAAAFESSPGEELYQRKNQGGRGPSIWMDCVNEIANDKHVCNFVGCNKELKIISINAKTKKSKHQWSTVKNHYKSFHPQEFARKVSTSKENEMVPLIASNNKQVSTRKIEKKTSMKES